MILKINRIFSIAALLLLTSSLLIGCVERPKRLTQEQVLNIIWKDFSPSTSSQERNNWEHISFDLVNGREAVGEFSTVPISQCPGPALPENKAIRASSQYWFVRIAPREINITLPDTSPTANEHIVPEPLIQQASYLVDAITGEIVARRFFCNK